MRRLPRRAPNILKWYAMVPQDAVQVTVQKGRVTLTGDVIWQYRERPEDAVRKLSGGHRRNKQHLDQSTAAVSDIKKKIEDALTRHAQVEAQAIRVTVREENKVSLEGRVGSWDEREAVEIAAWSAAGVQSVDDRLTIVR